MIWRANSIMQETELILLALGSQDARSAGSAEQPNQHKEGFGSGPTRNK